MDGALATGLAKECTGGGAVRRRCVFYVPGYDPLPSRRYRELYRREGAAQAAISGYALTVSRVPGGWQVAALFDGQLVETRVEVLEWSDVVQGSMRKGIAATYGLMLRTLWVYLRSGALLRLMRLRRGPVIVAFYPVVMLLAQLLVAGLAGAGAVLLSVAGPVAWAFGGAVAAGVLVAFRRQDHRLFAHYLMQDFAFSASGKGGYPPVLEARLADFRNRIATALAGPWDEVLVVGHSSGVHLAVSVLAGLTRDGLPERRPALGLLSLGQVVPMVSFLPRAHRLRRDLHDMAAQQAVTWVDVTAPGDPCCFALCDPVGVTGVAGPEARWPLVLSAAFRQTLDPARRRALRWRFFRRHLQYLCAFDRPGIYDYFAITAGPRTLAARFAGIRGSPGRITQALSPHRSIAE